MKKITAEKKYELLKESADMLDITTKEMDKLIRDYMFFLVFSALHGNRLVIPGGFGNIRPVVKKGKRVLLWHQRTTAKIRYKNDRFFAARFYSLFRHENIADIVKCFPEVIQKYKKYYEVYDK